MSAPAAASGAPPLPADTGRLLVVCPTWVGDTIMATCVLRAARQRLPEATIVAVTRPGLDALLDGCPDVDARLPLDMKGPLGPWRAARRLRAEGADAALLLPNSFRSALTARLAGVPVRVGYDRDGRRRLLTHAVPVERHDVPTSTVLEYARLGAAALGLDAIDPRLALGVTATERAAADALLADVAGPFVLLNPGANRTDKRWPAERFAQLADALHERHGLAAAVTGAPGERDVTAAVVRAAVRPVVDLAERGVDLGALKAVVARAALLVTNDTGPRHVAAALGTPIVGLFGPTDYRWTALPGVREHPLVAEPFLPDTLVADRHAALCAIDRITVADALAAAEALLGAPPGRDRAARPAG